MRKQIEHACIVVGALIVNGILGFIADTYSGMWVSWFISIIFAYILAKYIAWVMYNDVDA